MKKIIRIMFFVLTLILFIPNDSYAYQGGLLEGYGGYASTDNNINTSDVIRQSPSQVFNLEKETDIGYIYIQRTNAYPQVKFFDSLGNLLTQLVFDGMSGFVEVNVKNVKRIEVNILMGSYTRLYEFDAYEMNDTIPPANIRNLKESHTDTTIFLSWDMPQDDDFSHVRIFKNGVVIEEKYTDSNLFLDSLQPNTIYDFLITSLDFSGNESDGTFISVKTDPTPIKPLPEVKNLYSLSEFNNVKIYWENPYESNFHHVNIYRKMIEKSSQSVLSRVFIGEKVFANTEEYTPMFQTNGTYWKDMTVTEDTDYGYKLTTETTEGLESQGITFQTYTPPEPLPEMDGEEIVKEENGDYKLTWTSPTTGKVKILVDNKEYKTVDASLKEYVIPAADMVYDFLGKPKVQLVAVSDTGKEGVPSKPPVNNGGGGGAVGVTLPDGFNVNAFLKTVMSLIAWVGPFFLLALAIRFAPRIIAFLKGVIAKYKEGKLRL